ncbi:hypothetical protein [Tenggerimyces flavus]|uniref:Uncharacterized protein n=1 Tax=Tenggerimyces flavus TaxID=1708749 RepID=A0ABV7YLD1_9ACTN|nr:hypothetical protein [Tenggerimyces flavus]MBM7787626.1 hypothetical protein [Tenggerimyces flavus]
MNLLLGLGIVAGIVVFFWVFRSTPKQGQHILARWKVQNPTVEQGRLVADYLKERRNLYPYVLLAVFVGGALLGLLVTFPSANWLGYVLATVLATLLITDLAASRRKRTERTRTATLTARRVSDLVPPYGLAVLGAQLAIGVTALGASIAIQPWADAANAWRIQHRAELETAAVDISPAVVPTDLGPTVAGFLALLFAGVAAFLLVRIARDRGPLTYDTDVDDALRVRSARVGVASAVLMSGGLLWTMLDRLVAWARPINALRPDAEAERLAADLPYADPSMLLWYDAATWLLVLAPVAAFLTWGLLLNPWRTQRLAEATG